MPAFVAGLAGAFQLLPHRFGGNGVVEQGRHRQQALSIERSEGLPVGNFQEKVEVIGHQATEPPEWRWRDG